MCCFETTLEIESTLFLLPSCNLKKNGWHGWKLENFFHKQQAKEKKTAVFSTVRKMSHHLLAERSEKQKKTRNVYRSAPSLRNNNTSSSFVYCLSVCAQYIFVCLMKIDYSFRMGKVLLFSLDRFIICRCIHMDLSPFTMLPTPSTTQLQI